ncbi:Uncharacterised protein [Achromobacter ruhlandii]|nr:Uncharacterised protein [Achromobacter ruhlandii]CUJ64915.1 Uncharacterised protein [Achromobacter ruhlandii]CUK20123.1 Uncharacterised protein [Achromobacter ruhlandii]
MRLIIRSGGESAMEEWREQFKRHAPDRAYPQFCVRGIS